MTARDIVKQRIEIFVTALIASAFLVGLFDLPPGIINVVVTLGVGFILGGFAATIVFAFGGEALQDIEIGIYGVSISAFTVVTFFVRHTLF